MVNFHPDGGPTKHNDEVAAMERALNVSKLDKGATGTSNQENMRLNHATTKAEQNSRITKTKFCRSPGPAQKPKSSGSGLIVIPKDRVTKARSNERREDSPPHEVNLNEVYNLKKLNDGDAPKNKVVLTKSLK